MAAAGQISQKEYNDLSVRYELQADYLAGWPATSTRRAT